MPRLYPSLAERLAARSERVESGCILWTGPPNDAMGYGRMSVAGKMTYVHRVAWELVNGPVPAGMVLRHSCDVTNCINVEHLVVGTQQENVSDMFTRGRVDRRGERNNWHRLTDGQVAEIRRRSALGTQGTRLARDFGVSESQISNIILNRQWKAS